MKMYVVRLSNARICVSYYVGDLYEATHWVHWKSVQHLSAATRVDLATAIRVFLSISRCHETSGQNCGHMILHICQLGNSGKIIRELGKSYLTSMPEYTLALLQQDRT